MLKERYRIYEGENYVGTFNVEYSKEIGRELSANVIGKPISFIFLYDESGYVAPEKLKLWIEERIIPPTRIRIEENLAGMGLSEYDELSILKYTNGRYASDDCWIDFSKNVLSEV